MVNIICDLDGTLFDINHRLHFLEKSQWDEFFEAVKDDTPNQWCVELLRGMQELGYNIIFVTGRNEITRTVTIEKINEAGIHDFELYMRANKDRNPDFVAKKGIYKKQLAGRSILFVIEDRGQVVQMWRRLGLTVLQCDEGRF